ncbi:MAG: zinc finger, CDGSH-type domain protein [Pseudarthrobacter sp.]|nr:zinc finger, CDGSH-type domain protein [Pseudarthrobacter sp.]
MTAQDPGGNPELADGSIVVCPDGPLLVRGDFEIVTPSGEPVPRQRQTVALCRCGASAIKPYCDGTHKLIKFRTEPAAPAAQAAPAEG